MKIFLDDTRSAPQGWILARWPEDVIKAIRTGGVSEISLDHDLGEGSDLAHPRTGMDVLNWLEREVLTNNLKPPLIRIHTANPVASQRMHAVASKLNQYVV